jgi:hypothetical protein
MFYILSWRLTAPNNTVMLTDMSRDVKFGLIREDSTTSKIMYIAPKYGPTCIPQTVISAVYHML